MKTTNCVWEKDNLQKNTCEVTLDQDEVLTSAQIQTLESNFDYLVVKTPEKSVAAYKTLCDNGFHFVESQIDLHFRVSKQNTQSKLVKYFLPKVRLEKCDEKQTAIIIRKIYEGLFTTDRISLDSNFGIKCANKRYANWIMNTIKNPDYELCNYYVGNINTGFCYFRKTETAIHYILGALYPEFQGRGFGIVEPLVSCIFMKEKGYKAVDTSVSSNNLDVLKCYMECGFTIERIKNIFVKVK